MTKRNLLKLFLSTLAAPFLPAQPTRMFDDNLVGEFVIEEYEVDLNPTKYGIYNVIYILKHKITGKYMTLNYTVLHPDHVYSVGTEIIVSKDRKYTFFFLPKETIYPFRSYVTFKYNDNRRTN